MDFFGSGIPLGRWWKIQVLIHWTFVLFAGFRVYGVMQSGGNVGVTLANMGLLFAVVLMHEFGHALACLSVGGVAERIILWPLGGLAFVQPPMRPGAALWTTVAGPLVNVVLLPVFWVLLHFAAPALVQGFVHGGPDANLYLARMIEYGYYMNLLLLVFNLIPFYPMDGGRILQEILWMTAGYQPSLQIAGMVGTVGGAGFVVLGLGLRSFNLPVPVDYVPGVGWEWINYPLGVEGEVNTILILIGIMAAMSSWGIYKRSQEIGGWRKR